MGLLHTRRRTHVGVPQGYTYKGRTHWQPVQACITGANTATVIVEGRDAPELEWVELVRFTKTGADMVGPRRELRARVEGNTGRVTVDYADGQRLPPLRRHPKPQ